MTRVSLGAQSFQPELLRVLERRAAPEVVRRAFYHLRDANFDNISLDLLHGIPGQSAAALELDLEEALALAPEHVSYYELEAKPGTRFTHAHGAELARQAEAMEGYFELVVERLTAAGYRWYETANFCLAPGARRAAATFARATTSPTGTAATTSGSGSAPCRRSAPSGGGTRRGCTGTWRRSREASGRSAQVELLDERVRGQERVMLGLRLDTGLPLAAASGVVDEAALARFERVGLACRRPARDGRDAWS